MSVTENLIVKERLQEVYNTKIMGKLCQLAKDVLSDLPRCISFNTKIDGSSSSSFEIALEEKLGVFLHQRTPWASIIGEEGFVIESEDGASQFCWLIDPIDGTISFLNGLDSFSVVCALVYRKTPIAMLAYFPSLGRKYEAFSSMGSFCNDKPFSANTLRCDLSPVIAISDDETFEMVNRSYLLASLRNLDIRLRHYTDLYGHTMVAHGSCLLKVDAACATWDLMPAQLLVQEAGLRYQFFPVSSASPNLEGTLISYHPSAEPILEVLRMAINREG